jgi:hypothetical protein
LFVCLPGEFEMPFSRRTERALLNSLFGKSSDFGALATAPSIHAALMTASPTKTTSGTEANYTSYARVSVAAGDWAASSGNDPIKNGNDIVFPEATGGSNTVTHFALFDASTAGNVIAYGALTASLTVTSGVQPRFKTDDLTVQITDCP